MILREKEREREKKGIPDSLAIAFANNFFPIPGGPTNITPLRIFAPTATNISGVYRNFTISSMSCFASSTPATSLNVTLVFHSISNLALLLIYINYYIQF